MIQLLLIIAIIGFILLGVTLTHFLEKKHWLPNRLITGFMVFLIIIIPSILFTELPLIVKWVLYGISGLLAIIFFETSRLMLERGEYKGIVKTETKRK
ncbi:putative integral membrane protein [Enterococcus sp. PF1-24]|uniref:hypothetical protein n=1 Tax=unclassified Enterococcus TaxID=2608891 RepID=UPI00247718B8|nr:MULTISPECIES: hypothetical protein [unclassified Enterococcus]MDH6364378.1 putative integral membrane protein [Enterococcus sp. PFB1-1]MDH6401433.1 putative integral membrane protein [Enterococcus sp. PF1-24]